MGCSFVRWVCSWKGYSDSVLFSMPFSWISVLFSMSLFRISMLLSVLLSRFLCYFLSYSFYHAFSFADFPFSITQTNIFSRLIIKIRIVI